MHKNWLINSQLMKTMSEEVCWAIALTTYLNHELKMTKWCTDNIAKLSTGEEPWGHTFKTSGCPSQE